MKIIQKLLISCLFVFFISVSGSTVANAWTNDNSYGEIEGAKTESGEKVTGECYFP